jgi:hypothetical protein
MEKIYPPVDGNFGRSAAESFDQGKIQRVGPPKFLKKTAISIKGQRRIAQIFTALMQHSFFTCSAPPTGSGLRALGAH